MDLKEKVISALRAHLKPEYLHIENEHGVSGFVVAPKFRGMSALDRQMLIDKALRGPPNGLSADEMRQVMAIAGLTPAEAQAADARVRVHKVEAKGNSIEVMLHGGLSDAEYVRGALLSLKGVKTTVPKSRPGTEGVMMYFQAHGARDAPLTKASVISALEMDPYIEVLAG